MVNWVLKLGDETGCWLKPSNKPYRSSRENSTWPGWDSKPQPSVC